MAPRFVFVPARWLAADAPLTASDRLVLCILCLWVNSKSGECFPSIAVVAKHAKLGENTVRASLRKLEAAGALRVERGRHDAKGDPTSHLYTVLGYGAPVAGESRAETIQRRSLEPAKGGTANETPPLPQSGYQGGVQSLQRVLQSRHPNGVKNETTEVGSPSPVAASTDSGELKPANWRRWKDIFNDPQFKPGRRAEASFPRLEEARSDRVVE